MGLSTLPRRVATGALLLLTAAGLAACTDSGTPAASGTASGLPSAGTSASAPVTGASAGSACALLTPDDVKTVLSENVTGSNGPGDASAADGSSVAQCVLSTDGPALLGGGAQSIMAFVASLAGQQPTVNLNTGGVAVLVTTTATPITESATGAPLPSGAAAASGIGKAAYAVPSPTGGGIAVSQVSDTKTVIVVDLESKQVSADQLNALLKAAVARV